MTTNNPLQLQPKPTRLDILTMIRIGLFNLGLGLMSVLTLAVLNRVMISELGIPGTITAGTIAMTQVIAPARIWFGRLSDIKPIFGLHRSNYVRIGTIFAGLTVFTSVQIVWQLGKVVLDNGIIKKITKNKDGIVISKNVSIRNGPKGYYIFYKTEKMKKPKFFSSIEILELIENNDIEKIKIYIENKYKII